MKVKEKTCFVIDENTVILLDGYVKPQGIVCENFEEGIEEVVDSVNVHTFYITSKGR